MEGEGPPRTITMDFREEPSGIGSILVRDHSVRVEKAALPAGDYIIGRGLGVERKTARDFASSLFDGRLFRQAAGLRQHFPSAVMVIEGPDLQSLDPDIHPHVLRGALLSLAVEWQVPLLRSRSPEGTAALLAWMARRGGRSRGRPLYRPGKCPKENGMRQLRVLQGIPGVGPVLAGRLLEHFGTIEGIVTATEEELRLVERVGKSKARKIRETVAT